MPEPIVTDATPNPDAAELATLRKINAELLQTKHALKAKIEQLEGNAATLESRAEKAESTLRASFVDVPMKRLAAEVSNAPELWLTEFMRDYDVVAADDGTLSLLSKDGKAVTNGKGDTVAMTHNALYQLLAGSLHEQKDDARKKVYATIMKFSGASGGVGRKVASFPSAAFDESEKKDSPVQFGLR